MKYHKIRNVPLTECVAEQMIAYNLAFTYYDLFLEEYQRLPMQFQKSELISNAIKKMIRLYRASYNYKKGKYNEDVIFCALNFGFEKYLNKKYHILKSYSEIAKTFSIEYV